MGRGNRLRTAAETGGQGPAAARPLPVPDLQERTKPVKSPHPACLGRGFDSRHLHQSREGFRALPVWRGTKVCRK